MPRNVEIKARLSDLDAVLERVREISDQGPIEIEQDDTFFHCDAGRLKLRQLSPDEGTLIFIAVQIRRDLKSPFLFMA